MDFSDPNSVISNEDLARILDRSDEGGPLPFLVPQDLTPVLPLLMLLTLFLSPLLCVRQHSGLRPRARVTLMLTPRPNNSPPRPPHQPSQSPSSCCFIFLLPIQDPAPLSFFLRKLYKFFFCQKPLLLHFFFLFSFLLGSLHPPCTWESEEWMPSNHSESEGGPSLSNRTSRCSRGCSL